VFVDDLRIENSVRREASVDPKTKQEENEKKQGSTLDGVM
jgi:hypothetical protein